MLLNLLNKNLFRLAEVAIVLAVLVSGYVLFAYERKNHDPDYNKDWVAFYFVNPDSPDKGVAAENHSGKNTDFKFCLVPDNNDLMEPKDLSCNVGSVVESLDKNVPAGNTVEWEYKVPEAKGKYWVVLEYKDGDVLKNKDLSFAL